MTASKAGCPNRKARHARSTSHLDFILVSDSSVRVPPVVRFKLNEKGSTKVLIDFDQLPNFDAPPNACKCERATTQSETQDGRARGQGRDAAHSNAVSTTKGRGRAAPPVFRRGEGRGADGRLCIRPSSPAVHPSPSARVRCPSVDRVTRCSSPPPHRRVAATWMAAAHTSLGPPPPRCLSASPPLSRGRGAARGGWRRQRATATQAPGRGDCAAAGTRARPRRRPRRCGRLWLASAPLPTLHTPSVGRPALLPRTGRYCSPSLPSRPPPTSPAVPGWPAAAATTAALPSRRPSPPPPSARPTLLERGS